MTAESSGENPLTFMRRHLFDKIGMTSTVFETDPPGTFVGSTFLFATPRDWVRFGLTPNPKDMEFERFLVDVVAASPEK